MLINICGNIINVEEILYVKKADDFEVASSDTMFGSYRIHIAFRGCKERITITFDTESHRDKIFEFINLKCVQFSTEAAFPF